MTNQELASFQEALTQILPNATIEAAHQAGLDTDQHITSYLLSHGDLTYDDLYAYQKELFSSVITNFEISELRIDTKVYGELGEDKLVLHGFIPIDLALSHVGVDDISVPGFIGYNLTNEVLIDQYSSQYVGAIFILCTFAQFQELLQGPVKQAALRVLQSELSLSELTESQSIDISGSVQLRLLGAIIQDGFTRRASDVHFDPLGTKLLVRYRIDGDLIKSTELALSIGDMFRNLLVEQCKAAADSPDVPIKGQMVMPLVGKAGQVEDVSLRVNIIKAGNSYSINIRFIGTFLPDLKQTLSEDTYNTVLRITQMTKGLVLLVGPTGSGKSTLIYQVLAKIAEQNKCILTVEDPVEFRVPGITQVNINNKNGVTWDDILESYMRHDPDVILVGEIRSIELAKKALSTAETGHLVFSTLHTNDAIATVNRLKYLGLDNQSIADALSVVISQRLVKRVCEQCKIAYLLPPNSPWRQMFHLGTDEITLYKGSGCQHCGGTGYHGRISINEVLVSNREFRAMVIANKSTDEIHDSMQEHGFTTMIDDGIKKARAGLTTFDQLVKYIMDLT